MQSLGCWDTSRLHPEISNINITMGTFNPVLLATGRSTSSLEFTVFNVKVAEVGPAPKPLVQETPCSCLLLLSGKDDRLGEVLAL